jgi:hypothetical protein
MAKTDSEKLRLLAKWFDLKQYYEWAWPGSDSREVQEDLLRIANKLELLENKEQKTITIHKTKTTHSSTKHFEDGYLLRRIREIKTDPELGEKEAKDLMNED